MTTFTIKYGKTRFVYNVPAHRAKALRSAYRFDRSLQKKFEEDRRGKYDCRRQARDHAAHLLLASTQQELANA